MVKFERKSEQNADKHLTQSADNSASSPSLTLQKYKLEALYPGIAIVLTAQLRLYTLAIPVHVTIVTIEHLCKVQYTS